MKIAKAICWLAKGTMFALVLAWLVEAKEKFAGSRWKLKFEAFDECVSFTRLKEVPCDSNS